MRRATLKAKLTLLLLPLVAFLVLITLRSLPQFRIAAIQVTAEQGSATVPDSVKQYLSSLVGSSLFEVHLSQMERLLSEEPTVSRMQLKRKLPDTLLATVYLEDAKALVEIQGAAHTFLVVDTGLQQIPPEDIAPWKEHLVTIEVSPSYAQMLASYGLDQSFLKVMELANSLQDKTTLITRVKYDNNSSNSFGKMVLEISSLNAQIWVREPVGVAQIQAAVALVQQDQKDTLSFLSSDIKRYDLYREGLVRR